MALDDEWDRAEIVRRLHDDLGVDYSFLVRYDTPIEGCREAYLGQYKIDEKAHEENMAVIRQAVSAYFGLTASEEGRLFDANSAARLRRTRIEARVVRVAAVANMVLFAVAGAAFVVTMFGIARPLLRS